MAIQVQLRRGTTAQNSTFTGAVGEVTVDTTKDTLVVHDGSTAGGFPLVGEKGAQTITGVKTFDNGLATDTISEETSAAGVTIDGVLLKDSQVSTDQINEKTSATGVTVDGVLLKDSGVVTGAGTVSAPVYSTTGDLNTGIFFPAADNIGFATNGVIRGRWTTDGLCFGSDTAAANALDDYEEGTWTPASSSGTLSFARAGYRKIGSKVTVWTVVFNFSDRASANGVVITGAPFSVNASFQDLAVGSAMWQHSDRNGSTVYINSSSGFEFYAGTTSSNFSVVIHSSLNNASAQTFFVATYIAA